MNKKIATLSALVLFLNSCGPSKEEIQKVCDCESLYVKMKNKEGEYQINDDINSSEAEKKVQSENQEAYDKCVKLHKDLGDDKYMKATQSCNK